MDTIGRGLEGLQNEKNEETHLTPTWSLRDTLAQEAVLTETRRSEELQVKLEGSLEELVSLALADGQENNEEIRRIAFTAFELLRVDEVLDMLGRNVRVLNPLFVRLGREQEQDWTRAAYASLVLRRFAGKHPAVMRNLLKEKPEFVSGLKRQLRVRPVADLYLALIVEDSETTDESLKARYTLFKALIVTMDSSKSIQEIQGTAYILTEIASKHNEMHGWRLFASYLLTKEVLERFERILLSRNWALVEPVATILGKLLEYADISSLLVSLDATMDAVRSRSFEELPEIRSISYEEMPENYSPSPLEDQSVTRLNRIIKAAIAALSQFPSPPALLTAFSQSFPPFGTPRLSILRLLNESLKLDIDLLNNTIADSMYIHYVLSMFSLYPWNSALHHEFEILVRVISDGKCRELQEELYKKGNLVGVLVREIEGNGGIRRGNLGHVLRIGNAIQRISNVSENIRELVTGKDWDTLRRDFMDPRNAIERVDASPMTGGLQVQDLPIADDEEESEFTVTRTEERETKTELGEFEQGSDLFSSTYYWKVPISSEELAELD